MWASRGGGGLLMIVTLAAAALGPAVDAARVQPGRARAGAVGDERSDATPSASNASLSQVSPFAPQPGSPPPLTRHMVWPLRDTRRHAAQHLSNHRVGDAHRRRLLAGVPGPTATLPLHGSVQEHGYYYVDVQLGTPAKQFQVIVDTGSTATYVPCAGCLAAGSCGVHTGNPAFDPTASSTCTKIQCGADDCHGGNSNCRGGGGDCRYSKSYAEQSTAAGTLVKDVIHLGDALGDLEFVFGCTTEESGTIKSQQADGLMGMGKGADSLPIQLATRHSLAKVFSLCYGGGAATTRPPPHQPKSPRCQRVNTKEARLLARDRAVQTMPSKPPGVVVV